MRGTKQNEGRIGGDWVRTSVRPRSTMVLAALLAALVCSFPAAAIHQQPTRRLAAAIPSPPIAPVLVPHDSSVPDEAPPPPGTVPPNTVPLNTVPPNTVPLNTVPPGTAPFDRASVDPAPLDSLPLRAAAPLAVAPSPTPSAPAASHVPAPPLGLYGFEVVTADGSPARWNPCVAVHYLVNLTDAPPGALADVQRAVAVVAQASGLQFVSDGTTTAAPNTSWITQGPIGATGWPDMLIGWSDPSHTDLRLTQAMGGITEYEAASLPGGRSGLVSAVVVLNKPNDPGAGFGPDSRGALLLHELGHAVGLGHVDDPTQIMNPVSTGAAGVYASGDLAGLRILGSGACIAAPTRAETDLGTPAARNPDRR
jgi:hypothetical protein